MRVGGIWSNLVVKKNYMCLECLLVGSTHHMLNEKVFFFFQTSLEKNLSRNSYIFLLDVDFEYLTVELHVLIISSMLVKFQENKKSITMLSIKYLNSSFWYLKLFIKSKIINQIINNIQFIQNLTCFFKNIKEHEI